MSHTDRRDWDEVSLGDALTFQRGFDITKKEQVDGPYSVISSSGPNSTHSVAKVQGPGVVIGRKGSLGTVFFSADDFWPHDTTLWVKDFHGNDEKFAYYFLRTMGFEQYDVGASNPTLNRNHIHLLPVRYPPLQEQRRIAGILSTYDDLIENNTRRIAILEETVRAIYREWFVEFRFPGHEQVEMGDSERGPVPAGWEVVCVADIAEVNARSIRKGNAPEDLMYLDISSASTGMLGEPTPMPFDEAPSRARRQVRHGDTIWSTVRPNRRVYALVLSPATDLIVSTGFAVISPIDAPFSYLYCALSTDEFAEYLTLHASGSAYPAVNAQHFERAKLVRPPTDVLARFDDAVRPQLELKESLRRKNAVLRETRDLLLPKLISGEIDVSEAEEELETAAA